MFDTLLSSARRRRLGVCGPLIAVSLLAACDSDAPTSPTPKVKTANAARGQIQPSVIS